MKTLKKYFPLFILLVSVSTLSIFPKLTYSSNGVNSPYSSSKAELRNIVETVSAEGQTESTEEFDLAFGASGVVKSIDVKEGDLVHKGQTLANLDTSDIAMQRASAKAMLLSDRQVAELNLQKATDAQTALSALNAQKLIEAKQKVKDAQASLDTAKDNFDNVKDDDLSESSPSYISAKQTLASSQAGYNQAKKALDVLNTTISQSEISANQDVNIAAKTLALKQDTIDSQGDLSVNRANFEYLNALLEKSVLQAPADGVIAKVDAKIGEFASPSKPVIILENPLLQIASQVSEADIAKLKIGEKATITLDALGENLEFGATVSSIDQKETSVNGVNNFGITLQFDNQDSRIRPGMTANIKIITAEHQQVLAIPKTAVVLDNGSKYAFIDVGSAEPEKRKIETSIQGSDGYVEVISGIREGEQVVSFGENK